MYYYTVWPNDINFKGKEPLTYSSNQKLNYGQIVTVFVRNRKAVGLVHEEVPKPSFKTKSIDNVITDNVLPDEIIKLFKWLKEFYPFSPSEHLRLLLPNVIRVNNKKVKINTTNNVVNKSIPALNNEQIVAVERINNSKERTYILHGDTGTGKTRVYVELINQQLKIGKSSLILTPEIGLTPQLTNYLKEATPNPVIVLHSGLTPKQKRDLWLEVLDNNNPIVIVGPRSALFAPVKNLGLIVIDEAHDSSYKNEQSPTYLTSRVASKLSELHNSKLIFGSATPSVTDYFYAKSKKLPIIRMTTPAVNTTVKSTVCINIVKLTDRNEFTRSFSVSNRLLKSMSESFRKGEQSIVFLNRRGSAKVILCKNCGWRAVCPKCDTPLTYHADLHKMLCHTCNYKSNVKQSCPICHNDEILYKGIGTKAIYDELKKIFPMATIARLDRDNKKGERLSDLYEDIKTGKINILVGTQIITKGLDLPLLSTVGIINADTSMFFPDYTAEEITYQTLTQIIGRVTRGHRNGTVVIQTNNPDSSSIKSAIHNNYSEFYESQIAERQKYKFPPFYFILKISVKRRTLPTSIKVCEKIIDEITGNYRVIVEGPAPAFYEKINGKYIWQILIKSKQREELTKIIKDINVNGISFNIDPMSLL